MAAIGAILLLVGVMALLGGIVQKMRAGRLGETPFAPSGQVGAQGRAIANPKGALSTQGHVQTQHVLTSPVSGAPCVYFKMKLEVEWTDNNVTQKYTVMEDAQAVQFAVNDGSGPAVVSIDPKRGGEFCVTKPFDRKKYSRGLMASIGLKPLEVTPQFVIPAQVFVQGPLGRQIEVPVTANYFVSEEFLEPKGAFYVNGKLADDGSITSPSWASLLILDKSRDELLAGSTGLSKKALIVGAVAAPLGGILMAVAHFTKAPEPAAPPPVAETAPTDQAAPPGVVPGAGAGAGAGAGGGGLVTSSLVFGGGCAGIQLPEGVVRVMPASGAINVVAILNGTLHRVYVKLGDVAPGQTVDVCRIGRRCTQNLQVGLASNTFLNIGAATAGTITVSEFAPAEGRMNVTFNNVVLPLNQGADRCTLSGSLATAGFSQ
jgi:hypothetical protein